MTNILFKNTIRKMLKTSVVLLIGSLALWSACRKDEFTSSASARLAFSEDTLQFDTLLTQLHTITSSVKLYNRGKESILVESIAFETGDQTQYFMNVNGQTGKRLTNVTLRAGDSVYIFVQALLKANGHDSVQLHGDAIEVRYNGNTDRLLVHSYGIDAQKQKAQVIRENTVWGANKGFLIYDSLVVAPGVTLTIEAGAHLYFYGRANMVVYGTLLADGTTSNPIVLSSHRLDSAFQKRMGQWGSVLLKPGSRNNKLTGVEIKNATTGLAIAEDQAGQIDVTLSDCSIENMSYAAIYANNAHVMASNCVFANCSVNVLRLLSGGIYDFKHVTVSNYVARSAKKLSVVVSNQREIDTNVIQNISFTLINSIVVGSFSSELLFDWNNNEQSFVAHISNSYLNQDKESLTKWIDSAVYYHKSTDHSTFVDSSFDFNLDSISEARNKANVLVSQTIPLDKNGNNRLADGKPDLGAMEFVEKKK